MFGLVMAVCLIPSMAGSQVNGSHPAESSDQCGSLPAELQAIVAAMDLPGRKVEALARRGEMAPLTPAVQRLDVILHPAEQVSLGAVQVRPTRGRSDEWAGTFAGLLELTVPRDGVYRISASSRTWIDVLESNQAVPRIRPLHRLHRCGRVHKSVEFALKQGNSYWLEVSGSESPVIALMITPEV
jgi:hypothetical protein